MPRLYVSISVTLGSSLHLKSQVTQLALSRHHADVPYGVGEWMVAQMVMPVWTRRFTTVITCKSFTSSVP